MAHNHDSEDWELRLVRKQPNTHRSKSKSTDGLERELLREDGTNRIVGPTESRAVDDDFVYGYPSGGDDPTKSDAAKGSSLSDALVEIGGTIGGTIIVTALLPRVIGWSRTALTSASSKVRQRFNPSFQQHQAAPELEGAPLAASPFEPPSPAPPIVLGPQERSTVETRVPAAAMPLAAPTAATPPLRMSSDEYREWVVEAMKADVYAKRLRQMLSNVVIVDGETPAAIERAIKLMLEGRASSLRSDEQEAVMAYLINPRPEVGVPLPPPGSQVNGKTLGPPQASWVHRPPLHAPPTLD
jgi:hypothetical protein